MSNPQNPRRVEAAHLRSQRWFAPDDLRSFGHRSRLRQMGYSAEEAEGRPVIAILNSWSDLSQCHTHFPERVQEVKRGVWQAGGFPVEIPVLALSEMFMKPTAMLYRNLLALEVEEVLQCHPVDGAVLMDGSQSPIHPALAPISRDFFARHCETVRRHGAAPVLFMTWAYGD